MMTQAIGAGKDDLRCDPSVHAVFESFDDELAVPVFRPCRIGGGSGE